MVIQYKNGQFLPIRSNGALAQLAELMLDPDQRAEEIKKLGWVRTSVVAYYKLFTRRSPGRVERIAYFNNHLPTVYCDDEADYMKMAVEVGFARRLLSL